MNLSDHEKLSSVIIHKGEKTVSFVDATLDTVYIPVKNFIDSIFIVSKSAAFLIIRHDSIIYERYAPGFTESTILPSNSMAKSFTGSLVAIALAEHKIKSLSEPITNYLPELSARDKRFTYITIQHLLDMRSGLNFREGKYDFYDESIRLSLRPNIEKHLLRASIAQPPGNFRYQSINTQLLGLIIQRAVQQPLYKYFEEKIWQPMGAAHNATWNVDSRRKKHILTSAGLNATPRDFARFGRLYLHDGKLANQQVVPSSWVRTVSSIDTMHTYRGYKNQWWSKMASKTFVSEAEADEFIQHVSFSGGVRNNQNLYRVMFRIEAFNAIGFMNQTIFIYPAKELLIIRLGKAWTHTDTFNQFIYNLGEAL
jgi:CubicO group peptidase (beta-lactamase class C family)